jgi:phosphatidylserine/phosphatidylglycerophosphate/cardiolipin synthase-like enzyme
MRKMLAVALVLAASLSVYGQELLPQLYEELRASTDKPNGTSLSFTRGNTLPPNWIVMTDDDPSHGAAFVADVRALVEGAHRTVDICFLGPPPAPSDSDRFASELRAAVRALAAAGRTVSIRMLFGFPTTYSFDVTPLLRYLTADLPRPNKIRIEIGAIGTAPASWSHAKIIVADDRRVLVGGHNLYNDGYLGPKPVFDLSMMLEGPAAVTAVRYSLLLWRFTATYSKYAKLWTTFSATYDPFMNTVAEDAGAASYDDPPPPPPFGSGGIPVLAVSHNGVGLDTGVEPGWAEVWRGEGAPLRQWSDRAMIWLFDHARSTIRISQQDLVSNTKGIVRENDELMSALARAMHRGVSVYIILSNTGAGDYSYGVPYSRIIDHLFRSLSGSRDEKTGVLTERLHLAPVAIMAGGQPSTKWPDGSLVRNHAKFYMIDDRVFYIGSHNMYALPGTALQEFGYIVESSDAAAKLLESYWKPRWEASRHFQEPIHPQ